MLEDHNQILLSGHGQGLGALRCGTSGLETQASDAFRS